MTIKQVEALEEKRHEAMGYADDGMVIGSLDAALNEALAALPAEAWHPIEDAERVGAKGRLDLLLLSAFLGFGKGGWVKLRDGTQEGWFVDGHGFTSDVTHFRFITTPEAQ